MGAAHQRAKQYSGGHDEMYGGVRINIDNDNLDTPVATVAHPYTATGNNPVKSRTGPGTSYRVTGTPSPPAQRWRFSARRTAPHSGPPRCGTGSPTAPSSRTTGSAPRPRSATAQACPAARTLTRSRPGADWTGTPARVPPTRHRRAARRRARLGHLPARPVEDQDLAGVGRTAGRPLGAGLLPGQPQQDVLHRVRAALLTRPPNTTPTAAPDSAPGTRAWTRHRGRGPGPGPRGTRVGPPPGRGPGRRLCHLHDPGPCHPRHLRIRLNVQSA